MTTIINFLLRLTAPAIASAHEAYVLTPDELRSGFHATGNPWTALADPANLRTFLWIAAGIALLILAVFLFARANRRRLGGFLERAAAWGGPVLRVVVAVGLVASARQGVFLGPEIPLASFGNAFILRGILMFAAALILAGFFTRFGATLALLVFAAAFSRHGFYLLTYANYFGEFIALILWGGGRFSLDRLLPSKQNIFSKYSGLEPLLLRAAYGFALAWAAVNVKLLHPLLTITVVNRYNLTRFHWLFPHDPLLVTLGAGLAELLIGVLIIAGFELRTVIAVSLFYITLSLIYFGEIVWPHLILYGLSFYLLVTPQVFSADNWLRRKLG